MTWKLLTPFPACLLLGKSIMHPARLPGCSISSSFVQRWLNIAFRILVWQGEKLLLPIYYSVTPIHEQFLA